MEAASRTSSSASPPDEIYNLGAQSHVRVSFDMPEYTAQSVAMGTLRLLEAVRELGTACRFYQASSSEQFGSAAPPQNEDTRFQPQSPYACAKVFAHQLCQNYRDAYKLHISCGILFNHECLSEITPVMVRQNGVVNVVTPGELVPLRHKGPGVQTFDIVETEIWDGAHWVALRAVTATRRRTAWHEQRGAASADHRPMSIETRGGIVEVTAHHTMLKADHEPIRADALTSDERLALGEFPDIEGWGAVSTELAEFLGLMAAEGHVPSENNTLQFTNNDPALRERVANLWRRLFLGSSRTVCRHIGRRQHARGRAAVHERRRAALRLDPNAALRRRRHETRPTARAQREQGSAPGVHGRLPRRRWTQGGQR